MLQAYKYRVKPSKAIEHKLNGRLEICRELYNAALQERREAYKRGLVLHRDKNAARNILARGIHLLLAEGLAVIAPGGLTLVGSVNGEPSLNESSLDTRRAIPTSI